MKTIIAGIINAQTGVITETVTSPGAKVNLRLKVRDVLNPLHGKGTFMTFEFSVTSNMPFIRKAMKSQNCQNTRELDILYCRYNLDKVQQTLERMESKIAFANEVLNDCRARFNEHEALKLTFVEDAIEREIEDFKIDLRNQQNAKRHCLRNLSAAEKN